jgi:hypothetical protein
MQLEGTNTPHILEVNSSPMDTRRTRRKWVKCEMEEEEENGQKNL